MHDDHWRPAGSRDKHLPSYSSERLRANVEISESHRHANPPAEHSPTRHSFRPQCRYVEAILDYSLLSTFEIISDPKELRYAERNDLNSFDRRLNFARALTARIQS